MYRQKGDIWYCKYLWNYNTNQHKFPDSIWIMKMCPAVQYCDVITNPRWRTDAILKTAKSPYLSEKSPILIKLGTQQQILNTMTVTWPKIEIFKIQDGGGRHLENCFFGHNSSTDCPIQRNFVRGSKTAYEQRPRDKNCKLLKSNMVDGRHFENR